MNLTKIITAVIFIGAIACGYALYNSINDTIEEAKEIERKENTVKAKLELIRDIQVAYQGSNGEYADSWEKLISYADSGKIWLIQRTEKITILAYKEEVSEFVYDTLGFRTVRDSLFRNKNLDPRTLPRLPHAPDKFFSLYAKDSIRSGVNVDYVEVVDTYPFDRSRTEDNESKNRRPLRFGSRTEITTSGNW
jgi:hypothetical protein